MAAAVPTGIDLFASPVLRTTRRCYSPATSFQATKAGAFTRTGRPALSYTFPPSPS